MCSRTMWRSLSGNGILDQYVLSSRNQSGSLLQPLLRRNVQQLAGAAFFNKQKSNKESRHYPLLILPLTAFTLGVWQLYRLKWKLGLIDERTSRMRISPLTMDNLPDDLDALRGMEYRRVKLTGEYDHQNEIYLVPRSPINSTAGGLVSNTSSHGAHVITPFKVADTNTVILVDRGWVPKRNIDPKTRLAAQVTGQTEIMGAIRNSERENAFTPTNKPDSRDFHVRDIDQMAAFVGSKPVFLEATKENDIPGGPAGGQTIVQMRNEHFNYALTWFSLSALTACLWYYKYVKRRSFR